MGFLKLQVTFRQNSHYLQGSFEKMTKKIRHPVGLRYPTVESRAVP